MCQSSAVDRQSRLLRTAAILGLSAALAFGPSARARDLLRPGGGGNGPQGKAAAGGTNTPGSVAAAQTGSNARDVLARSTKAVQSMKALQDAARSLAGRTSNLTLGTQPLPVVPNGLVTGGLKVAPGVPVNLAQPAAGEDASLWQGAKLPEQVVSGGKTNVVIHQTKQQAVLNWETFNVGKSTQVYFEQTGGNKKKGGSNDWIAVNKIADPSGVPSQILGSIKADGAVYLINRNGLIFGGSSVVDTHSFVASSLPINDNLLQRGLLNNPDSQFLFSALEMPAGVNGTPAFTPPPALTADGRTGDVVVQKGARLQSPTTSDHVGGRIALIGANVVNEGTISTPDGQAILAAGLQVGLAAHPSGDATLRGLDVYIGAVAEGSGPAYAGRVTNRGYLDAARADVTMAGKTVVQGGVIDSSTSVALNGRIDLLASYEAVPLPQAAGSTNTTAPFLPRSTGQVTLLPGSVAQIVPESRSLETVVGQKLALASQVRIQGKNIALLGDALLLAPSATANLDAGLWKFIGGANPVSNFVYAGGQIFLDQGAAINVAGTAGVQAFVTENIVSAELRGAEFADSPLQRNGLLRGTTVNIDIRQSGVYNGMLWYGSPLFNAVGYLGLIQRPVGELTTAGGTVNLHAGGSVVVKSGATIDVSGGYIDYQGALVKTSRLIAGGQLIDISQATPDIVYDGFYTGTYTVSHLKYGLSETYTNPLLMNGLHFEAGYAFGGDGGTISITAPAMALDGDLRGQTVAGPRQRVNLPALSTLALTFQAQDLNANGFTPYSPTPPEIVFSHTSTQPSVGAFSVDGTGEAAALPAARQRQVVLSPELLEQDGFGHLSIENSDGDVVLPKGEAIHGPAGGSLSINAANADLQGLIELPGGALSISVFNISPTLVQQLKGSGDGAVTPPPNATRGQLTLGSAARLSTAGLLVDDRAGSPDAFLQPLVINGGSVTLNSYSVDLQKGSEIDVAGGLAVAAKGQQSYGDGGSIVIKSGQDLGIAAVLGGRLDLQATLRGYGGVHGGSLTIQASSVQVGGSLRQPGTFLVAPDFFNEGGFQSFTLTGLGELTGTANEFIPGLVIAAGTRLAPIVTNQVARPDPDRPGRLILTPYLKTADVRPAVSLAFTTTGVNDDFARELKVRGDLVMEAGSVIETEAQGSVTLSGQTALIRGSVFAPAGRITVSGASNSIPLFVNGGVSALPTVDIGPETILSARGATLLTPDARGFRTGSVLAGGTITVSGNIVTQAGAVLDVSGASDTLDFPAAYGTLIDPRITSLRGLAMVPLHVESSGGAIVLRGGQALFNNALLRGFAGGPTAQGGSVSVSSGRFYVTGAVPTPTDVTLTVRQEGVTQVATAGGASLIGQVVRDTSGQILPSLGRFTVGEFLRGGFDSLSLGGVVQFTGPISIDARGDVSVADKGVLFADSLVTISAAHITLGQPFIAPRPVENQLPAFPGPDSQAFPFDPTYGAGRLIVSAPLIDIGNLSLQNIGHVELHAPHGDVRGDGTFDFAGRLTIVAGQVYAPSASTFTIAASDYQAGGSTLSGIISILGAGSRPLPLSAGGSVNLYASEINQGGVVRAPLGTINLGWDGTGTAPIDPITGKAFATAKVIRLLAGSLTSVSAVDPETGEAALIPYGLNLNGTSWIDPRGTDITVDGLPQKAITISGARVQSLAGSTVDIRGGGDLYAYRFVPGLGGSTDVLASTGSFAIVPGFTGFVPYAPFSDRPLTTNLGTDPGYVNSTLHAGDQVFLGRGEGLAEGLYTLLPARYALLPGALLITPRTAAPVGTYAMPDGSSIVSGYRINTLRGTETPERLTSFSVASSAIVRQRAEYQDFFGNAFFAESAAARDLAPPRLPVDAGHLILSATAAMTLQGRVTAQAPDGARGGLVDISSPVDIVISGGRSTTGSGLHLSAADLNAFGAESLLIGGVRTLGAGSAAVTVKTANLTVDNAGSPLSVPELILVAKENLTLAPGAQIVQTGVLGGPADVLELGSATVAGSGDGLLVRVSSDPRARSERAGTSGSTVPHLTVGDGARLAGASLTLDSTFGTALSGSAVLRGSAVTLNSGRISIQLSDPGALLPNEGLVLSGGALQSLQASARRLSLLSYSTLDFYGTGQIGSAGFAQLALHAGQIRGFHQAGGEVSIDAREITLDNSAHATPLSPLGELPDGTLSFNAGILRLGAGDLRIEHLATVVMSATGGVQVAGLGSLSTEADLDVKTPVIVGARVASQTLQAGGALTLEPLAGGSPGVEAGLGASLTLIGARIADSTDIVLPSGLLTLHATTGDLTIAGRADVGGLAQSFFDVMKYTAAGAIHLLADHGSITLAAAGRLEVSAARGGGDAGTLTAFAPQGLFNIAGTVAGQAGSGGAGGTFSLDAGQVEGNRLGDLDHTLDVGGFNTARSFRVRTGSVLLDGSATVAKFDLSVDQGALEVTGVINAGGTRGGAIFLAAQGNVLVHGGAVLDVSAQQFDASGQGGSIFIGTTSGRLTLASDARLDLSVGGAAGGELHLRASQVGGTGVAIDPLASTIVNPGRVVVEGFFSQDAATVGSAPLENFQAAALANATAFLQNAPAIQAALLATQPGLAGVFHVRPGEEIVNSAGDLQLESDWDLSTWRFGEKKAVVSANGQPLFDFNGQQIFSGVETGYLTLRAAGSIILHGSIADGFGTGAGAIDIPFDENGNPAPRLQKLLPLFADGTSQSSWSYQLAAGADLTAADARQVVAGATGSLLLGRDGQTAIATPSGPSGTTDSAITPPFSGISRYQVIRTGAGSITINAAADVKLLNQFATIYSAGALVPDQTLGGTFDLPRLFTDRGGLELYPAQFSSGGGNVTVTAGGDIARQAVFGGVSFEDSQRELPLNWLGRRGYIDPATGQFGTTLLGDVASTAWWVDFSNFFQGVGALGGGNVVVVAGGDIRNVEAVIPTNARLPKGMPDAAGLVELGGGDLVVRAGRDIDAGIYYVERGQATLTAGNTIHTNGTRSPNLGLITFSDPTAPETWLPTTLFAGRATFDVSARGDLLLGPVSSPFLLATAAGNGYYNKTYFDTFGADSALNVTSLAGTVTLREATTLATGGLGIATPILSAWMQNVLLANDSGDTAAYYQPWLRISELNVTPFDTVATVSVPTVRATAFSGDINLVGNLVLAPSARGTLELATAGSVNGLQVTGVTSINGVVTRNWSASTINVSDANPAALPGAASPLAYQAIVGSNASDLASTINAFLSGLDLAFTESGSTQGLYGVLQTKQALHAPGLLHLNDAEPVRVLARTGDISGVTLFSPKAARIVAGRDVTDIALYLQNTSADDASVVATGRDIVAYNPNSLLRVAARAPGNVLNGGQVTLAGDIQISGPGTLEVLAGRNLDLGIGPNNADGTALGITSIGNGRNPALPFDGASIVAGAGLGPSSGLVASDLDFQKFVSTLVSEPDGARYLSELNTEQSVSVEQFKQLPPEQQATLALQVFFLALRDAGRDHNLVGSPNFGTYTAGLSAIAALFPKPAAVGDITLTSREIKTRSGGDISLLAPAGQLTVGLEVAGSQPLDQGLLTEDGGDIRIFTNGSVTVGTSRIFTLRGGSEIIWSSTGNIAAGASSKTVQSAPPTRVLVDPQSANVQTDLAGLATGGGIGVLVTVAGVPAGDVDLIAPAGTIDAGDAGIRVSGNLNLAAVQVLNASNIAVGGSSAGAPSAPAVAAPNLAGISAASTTAGAATSAATEVAQQDRTPAAQEEAPSIIVTEIVSFGGGDSGAAANAEQQREEEERRRRRGSGTPPTPAAL